MAVIECNKCMLAETCMDVIDLDGTIGRCPDFTTLEELYRSSKSAKRKAPKVDCSKCMFEVECDRAWITDGRADACNSFCQT